MFSQLLAVVKFYFAYDRTTQSSVPFFSYFLFQQYDHIWRSNSPKVHIRFRYASPLSGEAYSNRQLTTNFELLQVETFCVPTCFHMNIPKFIIYPSVCSYSECPYPEKRNRPAFVNISPTLVHNWYINGKVFMSTTAWKTKNWFYQKNSKLNFDLYFNFCWIAEITWASSISVLHL